MNAEAIRFADRRALGALQALLLLGAAAVLPAYAFGRGASYPAPPLAPAPPAAPAAPAPPAPPQAGLDAEDLDLADLAELAELDVYDLVDLRSLSSLSALASLGTMANLGRYAAAGESHSRMHDSLIDSDGGGTPIDERRPLNADGHVRINNVAGSIDVATWERNEVRVTGHLGGGVERLDINGDGADLNVQVRLPKHSHNSGEADLKLLVPPGASVDVDAVSADVMVQGVRAPVKVATVSGDIRMQLGAPEVAVQTVSGNLILRAPAKNARVNSVSGDLHLSGLQGRLNAETVSGNLDLEGKDFSDLRLKSISGDMHLEVSLQPQAQVTGETLSGEITMLLPNDASGTAMLKSFSGETQCPDATQAAAHKGRKRVYVFGDGKGAQLELSSFSGDIRVEKK